MIDEVINEIQSLFEQKKYDDIEQSAFELAKENPDSAELHFLLGKAAFENNHIEAADYYLSIANELDETYLDALLLMAKLSRMLNDVSSANLYYEKVIAIDSQNLPARIGIADMAYEKGLYTEASEQYLNILSAQLQDALDSETYSSVVKKAADSYLQIEEHTKALEILEQYTPETFDESLALLKLQICQSLDSDDSSQTIACLEHLHQNVPDQPNYNLQLISCLDYSENKQTLEVLFDTLFGLQMNENQRSEALRMRVEFNKTHENWAEALTDLDPLVEINQDAYTYQNRAAVKKQLEDLEGAIQDLTTAIDRSNGNDESLFLDRGNLHQFRGDFDSAISDFDSVLKLKSSQRSQAEAYYQIGKIYHEKQNSKEAFKKLLKAESMQHRGAKELLASAFADRLVQLFTRLKGLYLNKYADEFKRNESSSIVNKVIGKLWVPNMAKVFKSLEDEMATMPGKLVEATLESASKELFLMTTQAVLMIEEGIEPLEAFYKIVIESEHSVLLELQPSISGSKSMMRLSFFEGDLLVSYPIQQGQPDSPFKYFKPSDTATEEQIKQLTYRDANVPYVETIEAFIPTITG